MTDSAAPAPAPLTPAELAELDALERALEQDDDLFHQLYRRTEAEWDRYYMAQRFADALPAVCLRLYRAEIAAWREIQQEKGPCPA